jgi:hypothetical protein
MPGLHGATLVPLGCHRACVTAPFPPPWVDPRCRCRIGPADDDGTRGRLPRCLSKPKPLAGPGPTSARLYLSPGGGGGGGGELGLISRRRSVPSASAQENFQVTIHGIRGQTERPHRIFDSQHDSFAEFHLTNKAPTGRTPIVDHNGLPQAGWTIGPNLVYILQYIQRLSPEAQDRNQADSRGGRLDCRGPRCMAATCDLEE